MGWLSLVFEECSRFLNKMLKGESGVVSSLLAEVVATSGGPYGENLPSLRTQKCLLSGQCTGKSPGEGGDP